MKKKSSKLILSILILVLSLHTSLGFIVFAQVDNHWSKDYITWDADNLNLLEGFEDDTFRPDDKLSRIDFVAALNNLIHAKGLYKDLSFYDFSDDILFNDIEEYSQEFFHIWELNNYINITSKTNIRLKGIFNQEEFLPHEPITRYEVVLLARAVTTSPLKMESTTYKDIKKDTPYYKEIMELISNGIVQGFEGSLYLENEITRAEATVILKRIYTDLDYLTLNKLELIPVKLNHIYYNQPIFQKGSSGISSTQEKKFIDAITTLDYIAFVGYIPYNERHLYDTAPLETLWDLKNQDYGNVLGLNYYLIKYDKSLVIERTLELIQEGLFHIEYLSIEEEVEGINEFLSLAKKYTSSDLVLKTAEGLFQQSSDIDSLLSVGLYITQQYAERNNIEKVLEIYKLLYNKTDNIEIKGQLLNNYTFYAAALHGKQTVLEELQVIRNRALEEKNSDDKFLFVLTGLIKQLNME